MRLSVLGSANGEWVGLGRFLCSSNAHTRRGWISLISPCARGRRVQHPIPWGEEELARQVRDFGWLSRLELGSHDGSFFRNHHLERIG